MNKRADALTDAGIDAEKQANIKIATSKKSVYIYIAVLFLIVLFFILLSYFIQQRNNSALHTLNEQNATAQQNIQNLQTTNLDLRAENDTLRVLISELEAKAGDLEDQLNEVRLEWKNDVENVKTNDAAQYNELLAQYNELIDNYEVKVDKDD